MDSKYKICILANETMEDHVPWVESCKNANIQYEVIELLKNDWYEKVLKCSANIFIARPPGISARFKQLYDERIWLITQVMGRPIYPTLNEVWIYENKRLLYSFLKANHIPHPETHVFYDKKEALDFLNEGVFPIVAKVNIGASGSGIKIIHTHRDGVSYLNKSFSNKGAPKRWGPNTSKGDFLKRFLNLIRKSGGLSQKVQLYKKKKNEKQIGFVILQKHIEHSFEWRCVRIGDSFFAHKKIAMDGKASGTLIKNYENPPLSLFDFLKQLTDKHQLHSLAIDLFETPSGDYLVNEMQCYFGQSDPYQMLIDGKPGRYTFSEGKWVFEEGMYNTNQSYDLRLAHVLRILDKNN